MNTDVRCELPDLVTRDRQLRPGLVIRPLFVRDERIQTVIAAVQLNQQQDTLTSSGAGRSTIRVSRLERRRPGRTQPQKR